MRGRRQSRKFPVSDLGGNPEKTRLDCPAGSWEGLSCWCGGGDDDDGGVGDSTGDDGDSTGYGGCSDDVCDGIGDGAWRGVSWPESLRVPVLLSQVLWKLPAW